MAIVGNNSLLNQYVPTFCIKNVQDGQTLVYDAVRKAFVNAEAGSGSGGANRLGELLDVSSSVDNPLSLQNGQALTYNSTTNLWENSFIDFNTLVNKPTSNSYSFAGLSDTAKPSLPNGYVQWNSTGTQLIYSTTIPASSITGLAQVATSGDYNDLLNLPDLPAVFGTVTNVSATGSSGVTVSVDNPTTTPLIQVSLGDITPTSVSTTGSISASNFSGSSSGVNTGDQTITLTGDATGSGTGTFGVTLATVNTDVGTFGSASSIPQFTVDEKGRITGVVEIPVSISTGTVTSVSVVSANGISGTVNNPTTTPEITLSLGDITPTSVAATGTVTGSNLSGVNTGDQTITLTGDATGSGTGTFGVTLAEVNADTGTFGTQALVPQITVDSKGRITAVTNVPINIEGMGTVTEVSVIANSGISATVVDSTTTPEITLSLGDITPTSVAASGTVTGSNLSGVNTGDQTITLTGDATGSGTGTFGVTLAEVNADVGTFGSQVLVPQITVDSKGRITSVINVPISTSGVGTVTEVTAVGNNGVSVSVADSTTTPEITVGLGDITPTSVAATGTVTGSNLSGVNTGDQIITLTGDVTGSGTGTFEATLKTVNLSPGTYADSHFVPTITVNEKGLVTSITTQHVDTTVRDLIQEQETVVIEPRHQYIVTSRLEVLGRIENYGRIAIL